MAYYSVYVGGGRKDRKNTAEDISNVEKVLTLNTSGGCFTKLYKGCAFIAQIEHVLDALVSISYIQGEDNLSTIVDMVKRTGVTAYTIVSHGDDEECLVEKSFQDYKI